jgi:hypothetical protein
VADNMGATKMVSFQHAKSLILELKNGNLFLLYNIQGQQLQLLLMEVIYMFLVDILEIILVLEQFRAILMVIQVGVKFHFNCMRVYRVV